MLVIVGSQLFLLINAVDRAFYPIPAKDVSRFRVHIVEAVPIVVRDLTVQKLSIVPREKGVAFAIYLDKRFIGVHVILQKCIDRTVRI